MNMLFDILMASAIAEEKSQVDNAELSAKVNTLSEDNQLLKTSNELLKTKNENLVKTVKELNDRVQQLINLNQDKDNTIAKLREQLSELHLESTPELDTKGEKQDYDLTITGDPGKDLDALDKHYIALGFQHPICMQTRGEIFSKAKSDGLITEEEYQAARSMYNTLWNYSRD